MAGQTVDKIEKMLNSGITLFSDPHVDVKVHEYASHKITVSGLVENPGEKSLQREAIPLFVIRSGAVVRPKATHLIIKRAPFSKLESYNLRLGDTDNILIYPGDTLEFAGDSNELM